MIRNLPANGQTALGTQAAQAAVDAKRLTMDQAVSLEEIAKKLPKAATKAEVEAYLDTAVASLALASPELAAEFPRIFREAVAHAAQAFAEIARSPVDSLRAAMGALPSRSTVPRTLLAADFLRANYDLDGLQQLAQRLDARKSVSLVNKNAGALDLAGHFVRRLLDSELLDAIAAMPPGARPAPKSFPIGDARLCAELASAQALGKSALVDFVRDHIDADELPFLHLRIGNHPEDAVGARGLVDSAAQVAGLDALVTAIASELAISEDFDSLAPQRIESSTRSNSHAGGTRSPGLSARVDSLRRELEIADQSSVCLLYTSRCV